MKTYINIVFLSVFICSLTIAQVELEMPKAMKVGTTGSYENPEVVKVAGHETTVKIFSGDPANGTAMSEAENVSFSLIGAKKISIVNIINPAAQVYFIQLAAFYNSRGDINSYKSLNRFGNLYKQYAAGAIKIKLGYFENKFEANDVLRQLKSMGFKDAFITHGEVASADLEMVLTGTNHMDPGSAQSYVTDYTVPATGMRYKVRLASYTDPLWFSSGSVEDLGTIEQWTKGSWTIFVLGEYSSYETAESIRIQAINRGFSQAEVVVDNNGVLERLKKN